MALLVMCLRGSRARLLPRRATRERCEYARVASGEGKPTRQIPPERVTRYEERSGSVRGLGEHVSRNRESTLRRLTCGRLRNFGRLDGGLLLLSIVSNVPPAAS